ncbi:MAG: polysaccharide deacetylase family protein [Deltaproteobacteria bacterium]|nr:polysaccharide deacetylase family protein [Deltaproteobacteria bacterium]
MADPLVQKQLNISQRVFLALSANATSDGFNEWKTSGHTPEDLFDDVEKQGSPEAWRQLCAKLSSLADEDLALFSHELEHFHNPKLISCRAPLLHRLEAHWAASALELKLMHHPLKTSDEDGDGAIVDDGDGDAPSLASEIRIVDAKGGEVLHDGGLKRTTKTQQGEIALTFDDGPHPTRTERILKTLAASGVRATFFEVGEMAKRFPKLSRAVLDAGHSVGSHSYNHPQLPKLAFGNGVCDPKLMPRLAYGRSDCNILWGHEAVMAATGVEMPFFRFPYGYASKTLQAFVKKHEIATFFWNMDSLDWKIRNPVALLQNVIRELDREKGGIILFHDIQEQTAIVLPHVLEEIKKRGMTTVLFVPKQDETAPRP